MDLDPVTQQMLLKALLKLLGGVQSYVPSLLRKGATQKTEERLLAARTKVQEDLVRTEGEFDVKEARLRREHQLRALRDELKAKKLPPPEEEITVVLSDAWVESTEITVLTEDERRPFEYVEQKRLKNIKKVAQETAKALTEHSEIADEDVDPDWFTRAWTAAQDVSNEDMQRIWGKLLAGEIAKPGSFSLRTMNVLHNLSRREAQLFEKCCKVCTIDGEVTFPQIGRASSTLHPHITFYDMDRLVECGLANSTEPEGIKFHIQIGPTTTNLYIFHNKHVEVSSPDIPRQFNRRSYKLTSMGLQLCKLVKAEPEEAFLKAFCAAIETQGFKTKITDVDESTVGLHHARYMANLNSAV